MHTIQLGILLSHFLDQMGRSKFAVEASHDGMQFE